MTSSNPTSTPALLVDLDGVLRIWDEAVDHAIERDFELPAGALKAAAFAPDLIAEAVTGRCTDEDWRLRVRSRLAQRCRITANVARVAVERWSSSAGSLDPVALDIIGEARASGITVVVVTNGTTRLDHDVDRLGLAAHVDAIVNSADVGVAKPGAAIYRAALDVAGVEPRGAVFVDDTPAHVDAAAALGIHSVLYRDVADLRQAVRAAGTA